MKRKTNTWIFAFTVMGFIFLLSNSCKKDNKDSVPVITTSTVSDIRSTIATCGGDITSDGGAAVTTRGVCWSIGSTPTIEDNKTMDGAGGGNFSSSITGLTSNTTYFVRAYATTSAGTGYGMALSFTTIVELSALTTNAVSSITTTSAISGGEILNDGGAPVTARGICWNTSENPTIANNITLDGAGTGAFTSTLSGLTQGYNYYVRAYATNSTGTAYGTQVSFITLDIPAVTTLNLTEFTNTSCTAGGIVISDGGASVTGRGVCWSTSAYPTIADNYTQDGVGIGEFSSSITGLTQGYSYFIRAYATNNVGTAYGNQVDFIANDFNMHLTAGWHFDEGTGTIATAYSSVHHVGIFFSGNEVLFGAAAMSPSWVAGVNGGHAVYLDKGAHLEVPYTTDFLPADISISVWVKPVELYENNYIISQNYWTGYKLQTTNNGKPFFTYKKTDGGIVDADNELDNSVKVNQWNHIVITLNGTTKLLKFYINGILTKTWTESDKGIGPLTQTLTPSPQPFIIGCIATDAEVAANFMEWMTVDNFGYFKGAIDELKIYNIALDPGQVSNLYNDEKP